MEKIKGILIKSGSTIKHALKQMDAKSAKTLIVVNEQTVVIGTITDGDIRRWILKGNDLNKDVTRVMHKNPLVVTEGYACEDARKLMLAKRIECLPIVDAGKKVVSCFWLVDFLETKVKSVGTLKVPVVIMAGGEGTRLHPFTKILPKPLMPIGDKPALEIIIDRFVEHGCDDFYLSLNYKSNLIKAYFNDFEHKYKINYIIEETPLGTAGSLHLLKGRIKKTFFVSNCDILIDADYEEMLRSHREQKNKITLISAMKHFKIPYGVCEIKNGGLKNIHEKPEHDFLVNTGMYILEPEVLRDIPKGRFFHITDLINDCISKGEKVGIFPVSEKSWIDFGQMEELQNMLRNMAT